jgi:hypothetical protein
MEQDKAIREQKNHVNGIEVVTSTRVNDVLHKLLIEINDNSDLDKLSEEEIARRIMQGLQTVKEEDLVAWLKMARGKGDSK